jgi:hypothetical protein
MNRSSIYQREGIESMTRIANHIHNGHVWNVCLVQRVVLTISSMVALVAASGAGSHWF